jgi:hypothetical protein
MPILKPMLLMLADRLLYFNPETSTIRGTRKDHDLKTEAKPRTWEKKQNCRSLLPMNLYC